MKDLYKTPAMEIVVIDEGDIIFSSGPSSCPPAEQS